MREEGRHPPGPERPTAEDDASLVLLALRQGNLVVVDEARKEIAHLSCAFAHERHELHMGRRCVGCCGSFEEGMLFWGKRLRARVVPSVYEDDTHILRGGKGNEFREDSWEVCKCLIL